MDVRDHELGRKENSPFKSSAGRLVDSRVGQLYDAEVSCNSAP